MLHRSILCSMHVSGNTLVARMEKEKANCFRFIYLMVEVVPEILRFRLKQSYRSSNPRTLPYFLKETNVLHTLFHLFCDSSSFCCWNGCRIQRERPKGFSKEQWNILYDADSTKCCKTNSKYPNRICICCVVPKNIDEKVLDLSLLCLILNNCSNLMPNEKEAVQNIRELKNDHVSHKSSCRLSESDFLILWEKAELYIKHLDSTNIYLHQRENLLKGPIDESLMQQYFVQCLDTISEIKVVHASIDKGNEDIKNIKETVDKMNSYLINMQRQEPRIAVDKRKRQESTKSSAVSNGEDNSYADDYNMFHKRKHLKMKCLNLHRGTTDDLSFKLPYTKPLDRHKEYISSNLLGSKVPTSFSLQTDYQVCTVKDLSKQPGFKEANKFICGKCCWLTISLDDFLKHLQQCEMRQKENIKVKTDYKNYVVARITVPTKDKDLSSKIEKEWQQGNINPQLSSIEVNYITTGCVVIWVKVDIPLFLDIQKFYSELDKLVNDLFKKYAVNLPLYCIQVYDIATGYVDNLTDKFTCGVCKLSCKTLDNFISHKKTRCFQHVFSENDISLTMDFRFNQTVGVHENDEPICFVDLDLGNVCAKSVVNEMQTEQPLTKRKTEGNREVGDISTKPIQSTDSFGKPNGYLYINMDIAYKLVGRNDLLQQYCEAWANNCRIFGYYGMAKVGKTRLCAEFIKNLQETEESKVEVTEIDFRDGDLDTYDNFEALLFLKFQIDSNHRSSVGREQILQYVKKRPDTKFIFVFDSLEKARTKAQKDGSGPDKFAESLWDKIYQNIVHKFLANSSNIYFCLTSCIWAKFGQWSKIAYLQNVPALNISDSCLLLNEVLSDKIEDKSCLETIAELCDGLPGSIINVGSDIIRSTELTNEDMVSILIDRKLPALSGEFFPASVRIDSNVNGMIRKLSTERKENLRVIAASGPKMSMSVAAQAFDYDKQALFKFDVLLPLQYRSLVNASMKSKDISVHPVTQEFMEVHHASTTIRDKAIVKKIQKLIEEICEQMDQTLGKSMEYIDQLKDYKSKGCPDNYVPVSGDSSGSLEPSHSSSRDTRSDNIRIRTNVSHTSTGNPRLNDLSPASSLEKNDKQRFAFPADSYLHKSMEQKHSFRKDNKYAGSGVSGEMKCESGYQANTNGEQKEIKQKRLSEVKVNLGCSIVENDRIAVTSDRRLSDIIKRNNLSRSASAQEIISETKANNLSRAMTLQESLAQLQFKRKTLNRVDVFEDTGDVNWDDCSGSSQNILAESITQSSICSTDSRNSPCERNDTIAMDDSVNVPCNESENEVKFQVYSESFSPEDLKQDLKSNDPPILRPKPSLTKSHIKDKNDNSLKRLFFGQIDLTESETSLKRPVEHSCTFGPTLDPNSLLDESISNNLESHCVCQGNSLISSQQSSYKDPAMPKLSVLSLLSKLFEKLLIYSKTFTNSDCKKRRTK